MKVGDTVKLIGKLEPIEEDPKPGTERVVTWVGFDGRISVRWNGERGTSMAWANQVTMTAYP